MCFRGGGDFAAHGFGREIECVAKTAASKEDGMAEMSFQFAGDQVTGDDAAGLAVDDDYVQHFMAGVYFYYFRAALPFLRMVGSGYRISARRVTRRGRWNEPKCPPGKHL